MSKLVIITTFLLISCGATYEKAEDAWCASAKQNFPLMTPGPVKDAAILAVAACTAEEAVEKVTPVTNKDAGK